MAGVLPAIGRGVVAVGQAVGQPIAAVGREFIRSLNPLNSLKRQFNTSFAGRVVSNYQDLSRVSKVPNSSPKIIEGTSSSSYGTAGIIRELKAIRTILRKIVGILRKGQTTRRVADGTARDSRLKTKDEKDTKKSKNPFDFTQEEEDDFYKAFPGFSSYDKKYNQSSQRVQNYIARTEGYKTEESRIEGLKPSEIDAKSEDDYEKDNEDGSSFKKILTTIAQAAIGLILQFRGLGNIIKTISTAGNALRAVFVGVTAVATGFLAKGIAKTGSAISSGVSGISSLFKGKGAADIASTSLKSAEDVGVKELSSGPLPRAEKAKLQPRASNGQFIKAPEEIAEKGLGKNIKSSSSFLGKSSFLKAGEKTLGKDALKLGGKQLGKSLVKKIPLIGLLAGLGFAADRLFNDNDPTGAALEVASGAAGTIPGVGTAASAAIDTGLLIRDAKRQSDIEETLTPKPAIESNKKTDFIANSTTKNAINTSQSQRPSTQINTPIVNNINNVNRTENVASVIPNAETKGHRGSLDLKKFA